MTQTVGSRAPGLNMIPYCLPNPKSSCLVLATAETPDLGQRLALPRLSELFCKTGLWQMPRLLLQGLSA